MSTFYRVGAPLMRCAACDRVSRVRLEPTTTPDAWLAVCPRCAGVLKEVRKRLPREADADERARGPQLYATSDVARAALQELARRRLLDLGLDPDVPSPHKHGDE